MHGQMDVKLKKKERKKEKKRKERLRNGCSTCFQGSLTLYPIRMGT